MALHRDCQFCAKKTPAIWDAKHISGPWAYMCQEHFDRAAHPHFRAAATKLAGVNK